MPGRRYAPLRREFSKAPHTPPYQLEPRQATTVPHVRTAAAVRYNGTSTGSIDSVSFWTQRDADRHIIDHMHAHAVAEILINGRTVATKALRDCPFIDAEFQDSGPGWIYDVNFPLQPGDDVIAQIVSDTSIEVLSVPDGFEITAKLEITGGIRVPARKLFQRHFDN